MGFIQNFFGGKKNITIYSSETWSDCQLAKRFFADKDIEITWKDIDNQTNREELVEKYNRLAVPTIVIGKEVILGFEANKEKINKLLKI